MDLAMTTKNTQKFNVSPQWQTCYDLYEPRNNGQETEQTAWSERD